MSEENVVRYRVPPVRPRSRRTLEQWLALRLPRLARLYRSVLRGLPLDSRLRRELLARIMRDNAEAFNRGDLEVLLPLVDPEVELNLVGGGATGFEGRYHGLEDVLRYLRQVPRLWESNQLEPQEVIDFGDRYLVLHRLRVRGRGSGVELEHAVGIFVTWSRGMISRADYYLSRDQALGAAGLQE